VTGRAITTVVAAVLAVAFLCVGGITSLAGTASACTIAVDPSGSPTVARYDTEQLHHAGIIATVGTGRGIPTRGQIIAVAVAIQESSLRNLPHQGPANDHDSLGLFQQRPSQGWGTPEQIMDPVYASNRFYDKLIQVPGWQSLPLAEAAQAVQRSAYPDAYAKWELDATVLVGLAAGPPGTASPAAGQDCVSVAGWMKPVRGPVTSGFRTPARPGHDGVDIMARKGTPIHAAASGVVIRVECNAHLTGGRPYSCDVDGDPVNVRGCGWYAEVLHVDTTVTRSCHMVRRPYVQVGQQVAVGQVIGLVGSSGHSSGPHLHLETHLERPATAANAVDPVAFFAARGIDLQPS